VLSKNDGVSRGYVIQNIFTAYLQTALKRRKEQYIIQLSRIQTHEVSSELMESFKIESVIHDSDDVFFGTNISQIDRTLERLISHDLLLAAVLRLNERDRRLLYLRAIMELPFKNIAGELGLSEDAAQKAYTRALQHLRAEFGGGAGNDL